MSIRSSAEDENGGASLHMAPSSTRHSRARGNPGLFSRISLDTRFRGYDGSGVPLRSHPRQVFSKEVTKHVLSKAEGSTKFGVLNRPTLRVLRVLRGEKSVPSWRSLRLCARYSETNRCAKRTLQNPSCPESVVSPVEPCLRGEYSFTLYLEDSILFSRLGDPNSKPLRPLLDDPNPGGQFHYQRHTMLAGGQAFEAQIDLVALQF